MLSPVSGAMRENRRYPVYGANSDVAFAFRYFWSLALRLAGMEPLVVIGEIFSFGRRA